MHEDNRRNGGIKPIERTIWCRFIIILLVKEHSVPNFEDDGARIMPSRLEESA